MSLAPGTHVVSVTARGRVPFSRAFEVTRDASISVSARQATTTQRKIAYGVFSAAAAAAIAGTMTLALANSADGEATDLLETTRTRALEPAEQARYESLRDMRGDRLRATAVLYGVAGAAAATATILFLADHPEPDSELTVGPAVGRGTVGIAVGGSLCCRAGRAGEDSRRHLDAQIRSLGAQRHRNVGGGRAG